MKGSIVAGGLVLTMAVAGFGAWYAQTQAFYLPVDFAAGQEIMLTPIMGGVPEPMIAEGVTGIASETSPIGFRACFTTPMSLAMLTETYVAYPAATPLNTPAWFDCFDPAVIGTALEAGEALAFLSQADVARGVDRVVVVFADGRGFAWQQLQPEGIR
jgi:hypothetical protein